jgi:hypothetical protein
MPKDIMNAKHIKRGKIIGKKSIIKEHWKDNRSVQFISTKHTLEMKNTRKLNRKRE